uniref:Uncharacterized protein n=1 Tax=Aureoumbra lagunensis TaxID=44058 RepID=A0A7S3NNX6_9STRA|mmetsp:Transcript_14227/g.19035  ORF Transcript_14227/g.19035 Transcript_14227/m.19035 type:complete len:233 (+) Transcript_14227:441-1139(+)|eukprot:CAMPEP_0197323336 /NCGR_PEP_ID=MMETSP0891-20130614/70461_1 /TAXON_ID=44058 ORGANISM="Aureoumbra lagunensis, Strain CCMP1510" /NCGR_SAMPLE_ID=MMETSP0891 /ASSEMBLY_ACC=CAM_ASM_000534 /LENGTH=232 /DNA_ID=CAMNT_0042815959 /DNA_START=552 /DNA_END=1250 /DNA_ORIENTATION=+
MTNVEGRMTKVEGRIDDTENAIKEVRHYAENIDANLVKLKKQLRTHFKRKAAASSASAFLNIVTLGMASGIGSTVSALCDSVFSKVVDFTDTKHVFKAIRSQNNSSPAGSELAQAFTQGKIEAWIDKPLAEIIQEPEALAATLGDAKTTFTQLKEDLDLDDDDFMDTLQCLFNTNFTDISPDAENICRNLIDAKGKGSIKYIHWKLFYDTWSRSGLSMPEYLQSNDTKLLIG